MPKGKNSGWEKVETNFWKPEDEGEELIGEIGGVEETNFGNAFKIITEDGAMLVNYTTLNSKLKGHIGKEVKIVYKGTEKSQKRDTNYKKFDVYTKKKEEG